MPRASLYAAVDGWTAAATIVSAAATLALVVVTLVYVQLTRRIALHPVTASLNVEVVENGGEAEFVLSNMGRGLARNLRGSVTLYSMRPDHPDVAVELAKASLAPSLTLNLKGPMSIANAERSMSLVELRSVFLRAEVAARYSDVGEPQVFSETINLQNLGVRVSWVPLQD